MEEYEANRVSGLDLLETERPYRERILKSGEEPFTDPQKTCSLGKLSCEVVCLFLLSKEFHIVRIARHFL